MTKFTDDKGVAIKEQILKIVNDNRCDDHRCSKVADLNENAAQTILAILAQEVNTARFDEQIRTKISTVQRGEIVFHLPNEVITQKTRLSQLRKAGLV